MRTLAIFAVGLLVAACGGSVTSTGVTPTPGPGGAATNPPATTTGVQPPAGATIDPCALLSEDDILEATGREVDTMTPGSVMGIFANGCEWELALGDDDMVPVSIQLGAISPGGRDYYDRYLKIVATGSVPGIGDEAATSDAGGIDAVKGDTLLSFFVIAFGDDEDQITHDLAVAAFEKVP